MSSNNPFWYCAIPGRGKKAEQFEKASRLVSSFGGTAHKMEMPPMKVGTLDALMLLVDELEKLDKQCDLALRRIARAWEGDVSDEKNPTKLSDLKVEDVSPVKYMQGFRWDDAQFPPKGTLSDLVTTIYGTVVTSEDEVKGKSLEYQSIKNALTQLKRKSGGNLLIKDLHGIVDQTHYVAHDDGQLSEKIIPVFVCINKFKVQDFLGEYEEMSKQVVPRSYRKIEEDDSYVLARVLHLNCASLDSFKEKLVKKKYAVREFTYDSQAVEVNEDEAKRLAAEEVSCRKTYKDVLYVMFSEIFKCHLHLKAIFLFAESVLWFGLPPDFQAMVVQVNPKREGALRKGMNEAFPFAKGSAAQRAGEDGAEEDSFIIKPTDMDYLLGSS